MASVDARKIRQRLVKRLDKAAKANQEFVWLTIDEARAMLAVEGSNAEPPRPHQRPESAATGEIAGTCAHCPHPLSEHGALGCRQCKCDLQPFAANGGA
jgi:hypothetical protein